MDLYALYRRLEYEFGSELDGAQVRLLTPSGEVYDILSLNYDTENEQYVLIGEEISE